MTAQFPRAQRVHDETQIQALVGRAMHGDESAFGALYETCASGVYRLAYSILLHSEDAEDVTQEALIYAFRNLKSYDIERGMFRTWLYTITVSRCRNARRRKWLPTVDFAELSGVEHEPADTETPTPESYAARARLREALERALLTLSPRLREAIALRYGQDLTYREMAEVLGCPQKTAESRIRLAHEALRSAMGADSAAIMDEVWSFG